MQRLFVDTRLAPRYGRPRKGSDFRLHGLCKAQVVEKQGLERDQILAEPYARWEMRTIVAQ
eukprot:3172484-Pyramimonas_sp.AAC.1